MVGAVSGVLAAFFAWRNYLRKPKLRVTLLPDSLWPLRNYRGGGGYFGGQVTLRVDNVGRVAARNVVGRLRFDHEFLVPRPSDGVSVGRDWAVTVRIPSLSPNPSAEDAGGSFPVGQDITVRAEVKQGGRTKIRYAFVCDEGAQVVGAPPIKVPEFGSYPEGRLVRFLKAIRNEPREFTDTEDLAAHVREIGLDADLSGLGLRRAFRDALDRSYIASGDLDGETPRLTVVLDDEPFDVPRRLELSMRGELFLRDHGEGLRWPR